MMWFSRLFGRGGALASISEDKQREIKEYYESAFKRARNAAADGALDNVQVAPGQDPYVAGHSALFAHAAEIHRNATAEAKQQTCAEYGISKKDLAQILRAK